MLPETWQEILDGPAVVLNIDRAVERMPLLNERISAAGFTNVRRVAAVDGKKENMRALWANHPNPNVDYGFDSDGQSACALSHYKVWKEMVAEGIPFMTVFEDDVLFHKDWHAVASRYYDQTDRDIDALYMGNQGSGTRYDPLVTSKPLFCTHAYVVTLEGARKLVAMVDDAKRLAPIDCMIVNILMGKELGFVWRCWNGNRYADPARHTTLEARNDGLVFQDDFFESNIHCQNEELQKEKAQMAAMDAAKKQQWQNHVSKYLPGFRL